MNMRINVTITVQKNKQRQSKKERTSSRMTTNEKIYELIPSNNVFLIQSFDFPGKTTSENLLGL